jgi:CheY-like chemotaxis protein
VVTVGRRARLLVIDDEELVIKSVSRILSPYFDVAGATDARLALQWLRDGERFDAIICDLMMPQMSGMDFYASLGGLQPALCERVIFATGGVFTKRAREFLEQLSTPHVEKPFNTAGLVGLVTRLLA